MGLRLRATPNTRFLAEYLSKNYLKTKESEGKEFTEKEIMIVAHAALFLSCKMRERDIHCPMVTHILNAGEHLIEEKELRDMEIELSQFYDWNMVMMTYYDLLEQFMHMGLTFANDKVKIKEQANQTEASAQKIQGKEEKKKESDDDSTQRGSPEDQRSSERFKIVMLGDLEEKEKDQILDCIERRCLDLAKQICQKYLTCATRQREIAYLIVKNRKKRNWNH